MSRQAYLRLGDSRWNRFALPPSFDSCLEHPPRELQRQLWQSQPKAIETITSCPFGHLVVDWPSAPGFSFGWLHELRRHAPCLRIWLAWNEQSDPCSLPRLAEAPTETGLLLPVSLAELDCDASQQRLEELLDLLSKLPAARRPLGLSLRDCARLTPDQLLACVEFARYCSFEQLTLCDEQTRLTPLGIRNLLTHLLEITQEDLRLAFSTGDGYGMAVNNCLAAIACGVNRVHGCSDSDADRPYVALPKLLAHYQHTAQDQLEQYRKLLPAQFTPLALPRPQPRNLGDAPEDCPRFIFRVSADDWHVQLLIEKGGQLLDLGERVHHYVLLLLAREFCEQQTLLLRSGQHRDPLSLGWVERERLQRMIGDNDGQLNLKIFRASKQVACALASADLPLFRAIQTRVGSVRFASANFTIFKDSSLEHDVRNWMQLAPCASATGTCP